MHIH
jgi:hypothetical protein